MNQLRAFNDRALILGVLLLAALACTLPTPPPVTTAPTPTPSPVVVLTPPDSPTALPPSPLATPTALTTSPLETPPPPPTARLDAGLNLDDLAARQPILVHFSRPMDPESAPAPLRFRPETPGTFVWDDTATLLVFVPREGFTPDVALTLSLDPALVTANGRSLAEPRSWTAQVAPAPKVANYRLLDGAQSIYDFTGVGTRWPTARLHFDRAMDAENVAAALRMEPYVPLELSWQEDTLTVDVKQPLQPGTAYKLILSQEATDVRGTPLAREQRWTFKMLPLLNELIAPSETNTDAPIALHFNYPVKPDSVADALRIMPESSGAAISGTLAWDDAHTRATFAPDEPLPTYTDFTVSFSRSFLDANDDSIAPPEPLHFTSPPPIVSKSPVGHGVHPVEPVRIVFDRLMDREATAAAFHIAPAVTGTLAWDETTLTFTPEAGHLEGNRAYTITVGTGALGAGGEALFGMPYTWRFSTREYEPVASFGQGPNAQVLDADGRRAVQFALIPEAVQDFSEEGGWAKLTFELYALTLEQFLDRYASGFRGVAGREQRPVSTEDAPLIANWAVETRDLLEDPPSGYSPIVKEVVIPPTVPPGLYVLDLRTGYLNDQLIVVLTRNTLVVKQAEGQIVAWVTDIAGTAPATETTAITGTAAVTGTTALTETSPAADIALPGDAAQGAPVPGIEVSVYDRDGERLSRGTTDANGVFRTEVARDPQPLIVVARSDDGDVTVSGLSEEWRTTETQWWDWWRPAPQARGVAAFIYTDRPIYKPGQTVHFKALIRRDDDAVLSRLPPGTAVTARVRDARNNVVRTLELATNALGSAHASFELAEGAMLGSYAVEIEIEGERLRQSFKVEDYRKPDYAVTLTPSATRIIAGEPVRVEVESAYYFGQPVSGADVEVQHYILIERPWWDQSNEEAYVWIRDHNRPIQSKTDAQGHYSFTLRPQADYQSRHRNWQSSLRRSLVGIEATVSDGSHQSVSNFVILEVFDAAETIWADTHGYLHRPGEPFDVDVTVRDVISGVISDAPVVSRSLRIALRRWDRGDYRDVVDPVEITTGDRGRAEVQYTVEEPGFYRIFIEGEDRLGNEISYQTYVWIYSNYDARWYGRGSALDIDADRATYAPGETATLLIESTISGPALLTLERGTTRREQLVTLTAPVTVIEVPIRPDDAPNVFVTVHAWQELSTQLAGQELYDSLPDARLHVASTELRVPVTDKALNISITPDKDRYRPREQATFTVRVTDYLSRPVAAEVSLALVDEAIFALSQELTEPIHDAFYAPREHIVRTYDALALRRHLGYGNGRGGGGDGGVLGNPRSDFPDTAAWLPDLRTDANGELVVTLALPDSLTSWRLSAKAATAATQVGEAHANIVTQQEIVVRPLLPRALTAGDDVVLSAVVHNHAEISHTLAVALDAAGLDATMALSPTTPATRTLALPPGARGVVGWPVTVDAAGTVSVTVRAWAIDAASPVTGTATVTSSVEAADAVRLPLTALPLAVPHVTTQVGQFERELTATVVLTGDALATSHVRLQLSRSIAGTLLEGLDYLTGFPYGCVEQTMSKALPNAVVGRAMNQLGFSNPQLQADLPPKINASLQRLYGYQHNDGGWGWWYDDSTDAYQTAWVIFGLATTAQAGYEVDAGVIQRGVDWLHDSLPAMNLHTRAYALYSLAVAGSPNVTATLAMREHLAELDTFSRAGLALALHAAGEREAAGEVAELLASTAVSDTGGLHWPGMAEDGHYRNKTMASKTRNTALALNALIKIQPDSPLIPEGVRWLMGQRRHRGWGSTNETAHAIIALTDHLLATSFSEAAAQTPYTVEINGAPYAEGTLGRGAPSVDLTIPFAQLQAGENRLRITQGGDTALHYVLSRRVYRAQVAIEAAGAVAVRRSYHRPNGESPITSAAPGELVEVRLTVTLPEDGAYIIVEDALPGGLEALNERLNTTRHTPNAEQEPRYFWSEYGYNHKEIRGQNVSFFVTDFPAGTRTFTYYARATHAGTFTALPAEVTAMYNASVWGRSASQKFAVRAQ